MEKKMYRVEVVLYVMAEDEFDACTAATRARFDVFECVAQEAKYLDPGWEDAIPYNSDNGQTCSELLKNKTRVSFTIDQTKILTRAWG